ncbi:MAG TPA: glycoside hydrolase family 3 N-terminal domain-containing protein [Pseudolysinimonas sp.]|nr:glycoside hydrolase family 3 N-terminal domain-containing protein [Pseudolysinimonas sp.]
MTSRTPTDNTLASAAELVSDLSVSDRVSLLSGADYWRTVELSSAGIPSMAVSDGPHGIRVAPEGGNHSAAIADSATCFPTASALACSWDPELLQLQGRAIAGEATRLGIDVVLGPGLNIKRSPLGGRNFEYFSEDPYLAGRLSAAVVRGVQESGVSACVKHFAVNNQESDRFTVSADVDPRALREIYLRAFEIAIQEGAPAAVMTAYNAVNGVPASENFWLLTQVLREEWGWDGLVMSDWGAVGDRVAALRAGLDLEMPSSFGAGAAAIQSALDAGELSLEDIDRAAERVVRLALHAAAVRSSGTANTDTLESLHEKAREVAEQTIVLLQNDNSALPLTSDVRVAVVGAFADTPRFQGGGSSDVITRHVSSAREEIRRFLPEDRFSYAPGYDTETPDDDLLAQAERIAAEADTALVFVGLTQSAESEGFDRDHIDLPASHVALIRRVAAVNARTIVVLHKGSVVDIASWRADVAAILDLNLGGEAIAAAAINIIFGVVNPSGKTSETVPLRLTDTPAYLDYPGEQRHVYYRESIWVGYRYYDARNMDVAFPFGHGLSYTTFTYSDIDAEAHGDDVAVSFTVTNTGEVAGSEVAQIYVSDLESAVARPVRELRGFDKVHLEPGASARIELTLSARDFAFWDTHRERWIVEAGDFRIDVGASSRDMRLSTTVALAGDLRTADVIDERSPVRLFLIDKEFGPRALRIAQANPLWQGYEQLPPDSRRLVDETINAMPISTLVALSGGEISDAEVTDAIHRLRA